MIVKCIDALKRNCWNFKRIIDSVFHTTDFAKLHRGFLKHCVFSSVHLLHNIIVIERWLMHYIHFHWIPSDFESNNIHFALGSNFWVCLKDYHDSKSVWCWFSMRYQHVCIEVTVNGCISVFSRITSLPVSPLCLLLRRFWSNTPRD